MFFRLLLKNIVPTNLSRWLILTYAHTTRLRWDLILLLTVAHFAISYVLLSQAGESTLLQFDNFWYFYITTATTVGYGDLSPQHMAGRYVVTLFIMPGGIVLFTTVIAKLVQDATDTWRKRMKGLKDYSHLGGHIVLIGWREQRTLRMIELIRGDATEQRQILLIAGISENPEPNQAHFVRAQNLSSPDIIRRAAIARASLVIVLAQDDNETLTAALAAGAVYDGHLVAYFEQANYAGLLEQHCPNAESVVSLSIENTVRTAQDPGSSRLVGQLLSNLKGQTQYRLTVPEQQNPVTYGKLFSLFKEQHDATLLATADATGEIRLNPPAQSMVSAGVSLYFMAAERLCAEQINWPA